MNLYFRVRLIKLFLFITSILLLFWWPLSHWLYSDWYHRILGFTKWDQSMVKMIGTCGIFPVISLFSAALSPIKERKSIVIIIVFFYLLGFTFLHLIVIGDFPELEIINALLCFISSTFLLIIYPWKEKAC